VKIEALGYLDTAREKPVYRAPASYDRGSFGIQVGSYSKIENAQRMAGEMRQRYTYSSIREAMVNGSRYYRVSAGNYASLKQAEQVRENSSDKLISAGFVVALD
jgi:septal ring-binding cell division protein DamX